MTTPSPAPTGFDVRFDAVTFSVPTPRGHRELMKGVSFQLTPGSFVCVLGLSGAGKTTLVRLLLGEIQPSQGQILFDGHAPSPADLESVGYVPQKAIVHEALTVGSALTYAARLRRPDDVSDAEIAEAVREVETALGIESRHDIRLGQLSGGEAKRVSLAAELLGRPRLLVIDEATSSLDPASDLRIMGQLANLARRQGTTILCITHHVENAGLADNLMIIDRGSLVWWGHASDALRHFGVQRLTEIFLGLQDAPAAPFDVREVVSNPPAHPGDVPPPTAPKPRSHHGFLPQFQLLFRRHLEVFLHDRRTLISSIAVPTVLVLIAFLSFVGRDFNHPVVVTRGLNAEERELLIELWGTTQEALRKPTAKLGVDFSDMTVAMQLRVYLEANPMIKEYLASDGLARTVKASLAGEVPLMPSTTISSYWRTYQLQFAVLFGILLLGFLAGVTAIVGEREIILQEFQHGLRPDAYVASRFTFAALLVLIQTLSGVIPLSLLFEASTHWSQTGPVAAYQQPVACQILFQWLGGCVCVGLGLIVSATAKSRAQALGIVPILILPQLLLGGLILPVKTGMTQAVAGTIAPAYWSLRGIVIQDAQWPLEWRLFGDISPGLTTPMVALGLQIAVTVVLTSVLVRRNLKR